MDAPSLSSLPKRHPWARDTSGAVQPLGHWVERGAGQPLVWLCHCGGTDTLWHAVAVLRECHILPGAGQVSRDHGSSTHSSAILVLGRDTPSLFPGALWARSSATSRARGMGAGSPGRIKAFSGLGIPGPCVWWYWNALAPLARSDLSLDLGSWFCVSGGVVLSLLHLPLSGSGLWWAQSPFSPWCMARLKISVWGQLWLSPGWLRSLLVAWGGSMLPVSALNLGSSSCTSSAVPLAHTSPI